MRRPRRSSRSSAEVVERLARRELGRPRPGRRLGLEVGYRLIPLVDKGQDGELLTPHQGVRRKFAQEIGFLPPAVHIRDNLELRPNAYRITLKGVAIAEGEACPGMLLAIDPGQCGAGAAGHATRDPAFGLPAVWIPRRARACAGAGYTVVDPATVVATHLHHLMQRQRVAPARPQRSAAAARPGRPKGAEARRGNHAQAGAAVR